jgi:cytoplasmic iron level regulating protein YaaA (DUF328/UPF0246 family)
MYVGGFFKAQLFYAKKHFPDDQIFILSAKYGLLTLSEKIKPYDLKMGQVGSIGYDSVKKQAIALNIIDNKIISTAGKEYRLVLDKVFPDILYPFKDLKGMGYMIKAMLNA